MYHTMKSTNHQFNYVPPNKRPATPQVSSDTKLVLSDTNFPKLVLSKSKKNNICEKTLQMNFKQVAETSKELPDPATIVQPISVPPQVVPIEIYDLSAYVRLQEQRQNDYDSIYGTGAFVSDRLNYDRFASESEHESSDNEDDDKMSDTDLMDY